MFFQLLFSELLKSLLAYGFHRSSLNWMGQISRFLAMKEKEGFRHLATSIVCKFFIVFCECDTSFGWAVLQRWRPHFSQLCLPKCWRANIFLLQLQKRWEKKSFNEALEEGVGWEIQYRDEVIFAHDLLINWRLLGLNENLPRESLGHQKGRWWISVRVHSLQPYTNFLYRHRTFFSILTYSFCLHACFY